jgi:hypothetical protein
MWLQYWKTVISNTISNTKTVHFISNKTTYHKSSSYCLSYFRISLMGCVRWGNTSSSTSSFYCQNWKSSKYLKIHIEIRKIIWKQVWASCSIYDVCWKVIVSRYYGDLTGNYAAIGQSFDRIVQWISPLYCNHRFRSDLIK